MVNSASVGWGYAKEHPVSEALGHIQDFRTAFGDTTVIEDLSVDVQAGETFGFLGSNGSGKTLTRRSLRGICQSTAGERRPPCLAVRDEQGPEGHRGHGEQCAPEHCCGDQHTGCLEQQQHPGNQQQRAEHCPHDSV